MLHFYSFDEYTIPFWIKALYWGLYMLVFVYAIRKTLFLATKDEKQQDVTIWFAVFFALYAVFYCINSDYFNYREWIYKTDIDNFNKEKFYYYLILFCWSLPYYDLYEIFRLIVWGGAVFIAYYTFRLYRELLLPGLTLLLLFVFHAEIFCYARASLAMAVYFFGIAFYLLHNGIKLKLAGIGIAFLSYYFHREMLIGVVILPCLFIPFERKEFSFSSIFMLLIVIIAISFVSSNNALLDQIFDNDEISSKMESIREKGEGVFRLSTFIRYLKFFVPFYFLLKILGKRKVARPVIGMYRIVFGILMASVAFMIVFGLRSVYTYRVLYMSMIPLTLLISYSYSRNYFTRTQFFILMLIVLVSSSTGIINAI